MARFRCPSTSSLGSSRAQGSLATIPTARQPPKQYQKPTVEDEKSSFLAGPSTMRTGTQRPARAEAQPVIKRNKGKGKEGKLRTRGSMDLRERERLRMAKKKAEVKTVVKPVERPVEANWSFVYVGNLSSEVNEAQVEAFFAPCGPVRRVLIRASGGICVPTANLKGGFLGFGGVQPGVHYATVEFSNGTAARDAVELDGAEFYGREIVVSFSAADLPELSSAVETRVAQKKDPNAGKLPVWKEKLGQLKRLTIQRTEYVPDPAEEAGRTMAVMARGMTPTLRLPGAYVSGGAGGTAVGAHQTAAARARHGPARPMPGRQTLV
ncbi:hypothetical protein C2E23DRAFT_820260 [Lenzites betulinus]|nr:hypothetical protein C2E23DRAFT_820260 [Lenzites betulinus]